MVAYNFKTRFADDVAAKRKRQTIRAHRKRHARPGESVQLYTGMRHKSCRKLVDPDPECISIDQVDIEQHGPLIVVAVDGNILSSQQLCALAKADGFSNRSEFIDFFAHEHGLPFNGVLIKWN